MTSGSGSRRHGRMGSVIVAVVVTAYGGFRGLFHGLASPRRGCLAQRSESNGSALT